MDEKLETIFKLAPVAIATTDSGLVFDLVNPAFCAMAGHSAEEQVALNLLSNAIKFSPEGATVKVTAARAGTDFLLKVEDHGKGISGSFLPHIRGF